MGETQERQPLTIRLAISVPRLSRLRESLADCEQEARRIASERGIIGEPTVEEFSGWPSDYAPMSNPQGYRFTWELDDPAAPGNR